jgi:Flp pilus assembly pilin Flp
MKHRSDRGSSVVEFALLVTAIAVVLTGAVSLAGASLAQALGGALKAVTGS